MITSVDDGSEVARLAELAREGNIAELLETINEESPDNVEVMTYAWLLVVEDYGYPEAQRMIDNLLASGTLLNEDGGSILGAVHHELAIAYLTGQDGLPVDYGRARRHLHQMTDLGFPTRLPDSAELVAESRARLTPAALQVFNEIVA